LNILSLISFLLSVGVLGAAIFTATDNPKNFVDYHGFLVVVGGTIAATAISFQLDRVWVMFKIFWDRTIRGKKIDYVGVIYDLMVFAESYRNDDQSKIKSLTQSQKDPFLKEAFNALVSEMADADQLVDIMYKRADTIYERYSQDAQRIKSIGKYPPAMGLLGAVTGMIALLGSLGKPGAEKSIGPAMSVALVATMYGIAMANFFIIPIGENLADAAREIRRKNYIVVEGIRLIMHRTNAILLAEELNSFLLPNERLDRKKLKS
jgi:chemotaxis protein MotA